MTDSVTHHASRLRREGASKRPLNGYYSRKRSRMPTVTAFSEKFITVDATMPVRQALGLARDLRPD